MTRKKSSESDVAAWVEQLGEEDLRRVLSLGHARLQDRRLPHTAGLVIHNEGEGSLQICVHGRDPETIDHGSSVALSPEPFSVRSGDPGASGSRWLSPRARTLLSVRVEAGDAEAKLHLDLAGWRADCARLGAPELIALAKPAAGGEDGPKSLVSYLPSVEFHLDAGDRLDLIIIGRGPEDDPGRLVRRFFDEPADPEETTPGGRDDAEDESSDPDHEAAR